MSSIPFSAVTMVLIALAWPDEGPKKGPAGLRHTIASLGQIDLLGSVTLLCSCCLLIVGIQQAGAAQNLWSDSAVIVVLALAALSSIVFATWQVILNRGNFRDVKPIFPVSLLRNRVFSASLV
jgi:hypothetical protein